MDTVVRTPDAEGLRAAADALRGWQVDRAPLQLHPGDLGWHWRAGTARTAAAVRVWSRAGRPVALGLLDAPQLLRLALDPGLQDDPALVGSIAADLDDPGRGVLGAGSAVVEARCGPLLTSTLRERGWQPAESWTPLHLDLSVPSPAVGLRVEEIGPDGAAEWLAVHRSAFRGTAMTAEELATALGRWHAMADSPPYAGARCLTAYDAAGHAVAVAGVWSAGPGRPGLLEPIGAHPDHRGHGHGRAVIHAAAAALRRLGASSAVVCTPSANEIGVAAYVSAGFERFPDHRDLSRPG